MVNVNSDDTTILLGNGSGGFSQAAGSPVAVGGQPRSVAVGDFNGDGKQDFAVASTISHNVTILLGNGSGGFSQSPGSPVGAGTFHSVAVGDFNGDGKQDLAVANTQPSSLTILLGNGSGSFSPAPGSPIGAGSDPIFVAVADFNGDGKQDLVAANLNSNGVTIQLNTCTANSPPTITAVAVSRQQGSQVSNSTIANLSDPDQAANTLSVTVNGGTSATVNGVTISDISISAAGFVSANIIAACTAANTSFTLTVTDGASASVNATLNVTVTANTPPPLTYGNQSVAAGGSLTINPLTGPSDNGSVSGIVVQSQGTYTGTISVNNSTGVISVSGAKPGGTHTITIRATDNCGATTNASFTLTVNCPTITFNFTGSHDGTAGTPFSYTVTASGGTAPYTFDLTNPRDLPNGLQFTTMPTSFTLSGTPSVAGIFHIGINITDAYGGCTGLLVVTVTIACPAITLAPATLPNSVIGTPYSQLVSASPGGTNYTYAVTSGSLPPGLSLNGATGAITGTPSAGGNYSFTITATGWGSCMSTHSYSLFISQKRPVTLTLVLELVQTEFGSLLVARARLTDGLTGAALGGRELIFTQAGSGDIAKTTDNNGEAETVIRRDSSSNYTVTVTFAGDDLYEPGSATATYTPSAN